MKKIKFGYNVSSKSEETIATFPKDTTSKEIEEAYINWLSEQTGGYWEVQGEENEN